MGEYQCIQQGERDRGRESCVVVEYIARRKSSTTSSKSCDPALGGRYYKSSLHCLFLKLVSTTKPTVAVLTERPDASWPPRSPSTLRPAGVSAASTSSTRASLARGTWTAASSTSPPPSSGTPSAATGSRRKGRPATADPHRFLAQL